jgi:hypothetical protein
MKTLAIILLLMFVTSLEAQDLRKPTSAGSGAVTSVFTRTGDVVKASGDYNFSDIGSFIQSTQLVVQPGLIYDQSNGHLTPDSSRIAGTIPTSVIRSNIGVAGYATYNSTTGIVTPDTTAGKLATKTDLASKQASGTYLIPSDTNGVAKRADTNTYIATKAGLNGKQASGTYLVPSDTNGTAKRADTNTYIATKTGLLGRQVAGTYLIPSDTNGTAKRSDTNTYIATKAGLLGKQAAGTYLIPSDTNGTAKRSDTGTILISKAALAAKNYIATYTDSIRVGPAQFPTPTAADTASIYIWQSGMSVAQIQVQIKGGTSDSVNVLRSRSGTVVRTKATSVFATSVTGYPGTWTTGEADQNQTLNIGDLLLVTINAPSGSPANIAVQILLTKTRQ